MTRRDVLPDVNAPLGEFRSAFSNWLNAYEDLFTQYRASHRVFSEALEKHIRIQRILADAGWAWFGWPESVGGVGGSALHRAVVYDELGSRGLAVRGPLEHIEIIAPPLVEHWGHELLREPLGALIRGEEFWCQGFSEPDAGSDLTSLRTSAELVDEGYLLNGTKVWISWASVARWCLVLARRGPLELRHRGLSAYFVDLTLPGVEVTTIRQSNGSDEFAQVHFEDVLLPKTAVVGVEGGGWKIALDVLACERTLFAWLRHAALYEQADDLAKRTEIDGMGPTRLGELAVELFALRCATLGALDRVSKGVFPGPEAAVSKAMLSSVEQHLHDVAIDLVPAILTAGDDDLMGRWQDDYLFSRIVSVYGGTRQMQLDTLARFELGLGAGAKF